MLGLVDKINKGLLHVIYARPKANNIYNTPKALHKHSGVGDQTTRTKHKNKL